MANGSVNVPGGAAAADMRLLLQMLNTLVGNDSGKSARDIAVEELEALLIPEGAQEDMDELQEWAAWLQEHPKDALEMNAAIAALQKLIDTGGETVAAYIKTAIAGKQEQHKTISVTLAAGATEWTVDAAGVTAGNTLIVSPDAASMEAYAAAGVKCTAQAVNSLTFTAKSTPEVDLTVAVAIFD